MFSSEDIENSSYITTFEHNCGFIFNIFLFQNIYELEMEFMKENQRSMIHIVFTYYGYLYLTLLSHK